ncbi:S8 family peptidase [Marinobacter sp. NSM]|uniref:S8 family peptidase n=1 Tax=Marinobacter sp. NSM TaxID=3458004 RepID=UPI004037404C
MGLRQIFIGLCLALVPATHALAQQPQLPGNLPDIAKRLTFIPGQPTGRILVKFEEGVQLPPGFERHGALGLTRVAPGNEAAMMAQLRRLPGVLKIAQDHVVTTPPQPEPPQLLAPDDSAGASVGVTPQATNAEPTDPGFSRQTSWQAPGALTAGVQNILDAYLRVFISQQPSIGVLDSGFYNIRDLNYQTGFNLASPEGLSSMFLEPEINPVCDGAHGTAVTAVMAAIANNNTGITGIVAPNVVAARVLSCNDQGQVAGSLADTALGIRWLAGDPSIDGVPALPAPVDIINASLGSEGVPECPFFLQEAIDYAHSRGVLVVVAAGNSSTDASTFTPANCANVLTVAAVQADGQLAEFSNTGDNVDLAALGVRVTSLDQRGRLIAVSGTSFASPLVAGIAALLKQQNAALEPAALAEHLTVTARPASDSLLGIDLSLLTGTRRVADAGLALDRVIFEQLAPNVRLRPIWDCPLRCNRLPYINNQPGDVDFNALFELTVDDEPLTGDQRYVVLKSDAQGNKRLIAESTESRFLVPGVVPSQDTLWFDVCDANAQNCRFDQSLTLNPE